MASAVPIDGETMSVGRVFSRTAAVIKDNPVTVFGIAFVFGALPSVLFGWFQQSVRAGGFADTDSRLGYYAIVVASMVVGLILSGLVQGALVRATVDHSQGRRATFSESASVGLAKALPLVGLTILMGIACGIGMMLLLVPGVILYIMWAVASPALVAEDVGVFGAFGRSRELTKGARWKVFGVELIVVLIWWAISAVVGLLIFRMLGTGGLQQIGQHGLPIGWLIGNAVLSTLVNAVWSTVQTSLYVELRNWKDGHSGETLQEVFA